VTLNQFAALKFFAGGLRGTHLVNLLVAARNITFLGFYLIFLQKFQVVKDVLVEIYPKTALSGYMSIFIGFST